jgi:hypothetical protein
VLEFLFTVSSRQPHGTNSLKYRTLKSSIYVGRDIKYGLKVEYGHRKTASPKVL